jgi:hypothetical protein
MLRSPHGAGAAAGSGPRIEVAPVDELPAFVPAGDLPVEAGDPSRPDRGADGRFARGNSESRKGGKARAGSTRLGSRLALGESFADPRFEPYAAAARAFRDAQVARLARDVGGGECGPGPSSMVASAALQLAGARFAFEVLGDLTLGSRLSNDCRQNLLAAFELCAREAKAREENQPVEHPWERERRLGLTIGGSKQ